MIIAQPINRDEPAARKTDDRIPESNLVGEVKFPASTPTAQLSENALFRPFPFPRCVSVIRDDDKISDRLVLSDIRQVMDTLGDTSRLWFWWEFVTIDL